jgi:hypothetical protein
MTNLPPGFKTRNILGDILGGFSFLWSGCGNRKPMHMLSKELSGKGYIGNVAGNKRDIHSRLSSPANRHIQHSAG